VLDAAWLISVAGSDDHSMGCPRCIVTPHIAWASMAARQRLLNTVVENVRGFLAGKPINVIDGS
jgi:glycerate dehydrogenase